MSGPVGEQSKIREEHLERLAFVYVRQSSLRQVRDNRESQRRQYAFADPAAALGWSRERVVVVDEHGVYDPSSSADRMMLGIRGQVSEMERDSLVHRMVEARWNKARRGEAFTTPPAGYDLDEFGRLDLSSDQAVQSAVRRVFDKFDELGAARQVFLWWRGAGLPFPVRRAQQGHPVALGPRLVSRRLPDAAPPDLRGRVRVRLFTAPPGRSCRFSSHCGSLQPGQCRVG